MDFGPNPQKTRHSANVSTIVSTYCIDEVDHDLHIPLIARCEWMAETMGPITVVYHRDGTPRLYLGEPGSAADRSGRQRDAALLVGYAAIAAFFDNLVSLEDPSATAR